MSCEVMVFRNQRSAAVVTMRELLTRKSHDTELMVDGY